MGVFIIATASENQKELDGERWTQQTTNWNTCHKIEFFLSFVLYHEHLLQIPDVNE